MSTTSQRITRSMTQAGAADSDAMGTNGGSFINVPSTTTSNPEALSTTDAIPLPPITSPTRIPTPNRARSPSGSQVMPAPSLLGNLPEAPAAGEESSALSYSVTPDTTTAEPTPTHQVPASGPSQPLKPLTGDPWLDANLSPIRPWPEAKGKEGN